MTLIYIMSPSFSGSTLLTVLLAQHRRIASVGELKATAMDSPGRYQCSCGTTLADCTFWRGLCSKLVSSGTEFRLHNFGTHFANGPGLNARVIGTRVRNRAFECVRTALIRVLPGVQREWRHCIEQNRNVMKAIGELQGGEMFLDSSKDGVRLRHFLSARLWNVKVIRLDRDGRGVVNSIRKNHNLTTSTAIDKWRISVREQELLWSRLERSSRMLLRYEDLCREPQLALSRIQAFLKLDRIDAYRTSVPLHLIGNRMRTQESLAIRLDERWRKELTAAELALFESRAGDVNRIRGYNDSAV